MEEFKLRDGITGRKLHNRLNQNKLSNFELDEIFLDENMLIAEG